MNDSYSTTGTSTRTGALAARRQRDTRCGCGHQLATERGHSLRRTGEKSEPLLCAENLPRRESRRPRPPLAALGEEAPHGGLQLLVLTPVPHCPPPSRCGNAPLPPIP